MLDKKETTLSSENENFLIRLNPTSLITCEEMDIFLRFESNKLKDLRAFNSSVLVIE